MATAQKNLVKKNPLTWSARAKIRGTTVVPARGSVVVSACGIIGTFMRWPFSRKHRELRIPPLDEQRWSLVQGNYGGGPLLVRFNEAARELAGHPELSIKLGFAVPLNRPNKGGLPDAAENQQLTLVEDLIAQRVLAEAVGLHAMTLTTGVMKEYVFYITPGLNIAAVHAALRESVSSHEVQCMAIEEPGWKSFRAFVR
jgi:hypothetical protein